MIQGYMYILKCSDGSFYTGSTKDLQKRIEEHNAGIGSIHTSKRRPLVLVYFEEFSQINLAFKREKQIQGWSRRKKLALIKSQEHLLPDLAKYPGTSTGSVT